MFENTKSSKTNTLGIVDFKQMSTLKNPEIEKLLFSTNVKIKTTIFLETVIFKNSLNSKNKNLEKYGLTKRRKFQK